MDKEKVIDDFAQFMADTGLFEDEFKSSEKSEAVKFLNLSEMPLIFLQHNILDSESSECQGELEELLSNEITKEGFKKSIIDGLKSGQLDACRTFVNALELSRWEYDHDDAQDFKDKINKSFPDTIMTDKVIDGKKWKRVELYKE